MSPSPTIDVTDATADPVTELYKRDVDRTLVRENLRRSPEERIEALQQLQQLQRFAEAVRQAGDALRRRR